MTRTSGSSARSTAGADIRNLGLVNNLTDYTGSSGNPKSVSGLVGWQRGGSITASYATGDVYGATGGQDRVGVLVGAQSGGSITASYTTGNADARGGNDDRVGALVGWQENGSIVASYATGDAAGGGGNEDAVGALVGRQDAGSIVASYATGNADGGGGTTDYAGVLVGRQVAGSITDSYGFGVATGETVATHGTPPMVVTRAAQLTVDNAGASWNAAANDTQGAWDFGAGDQQPLLRYADYDGADTDFDCSQAPGGVCGALVPGQPLISADADGNGLIEIRDLTMLHNMRYNLAGTSYQSGTIATANNTGCPATGCIGYELVGDLDFDADGNGTSWSEDGAGGYRLDAGDSRAPYFVVDEDGAGGWQPIGDSSNPFAAVFDGNGYSIRNLAIRRDQISVGFFGALGSDAAVRNIGLVANLADSLSSGTFPAVGSLAGHQQAGSSITASYATGPVVTGVESGISAGGLVGNQRDGSITASYATGPVVASGSSSGVGGLVGDQGGGSITASYATGPVVGNARVGGLVGEQQVGSSITASYATGPVVGGGGSRRTGDLVGQQSAGSITASYSFGALEGSSVDVAGAPPEGVSNAAQLTATNAGASWNAAASNSLGAWDFGTGDQPPALKYADYDGAGTVFNCNQFPACDTLVPGQGAPRVEGPLTALSGAEVSLAGAFDERILIRSWRWLQLEGPPVPLTATDAPELTFTAPTVNGSRAVLFRLIADGRSTLFPLIVKPADADGDGLIEIDDLAMLHNMRHDLTGASYKSGPTGRRQQHGLPRPGLHRL